MIEKLKKEEYNTILELAKKLNANYTVDLIGPNENVIIYKKDNLVIGFIQYLKLYDTLEIINIFVKEEYRKQGIAKKMIDYLITDDVKHILLEVRESNVDAISFYKHLGFTQIRTIKNYYKEEDAIVMERRIK